MTMVRISIMPNEFVGNKFVNDDNIDNEYDGKLWWYAGMKNLRWIMCWGRWTTDCPPCRHLLQEHLLQRSRWDGGGCPLIQHWFRNLLQHFQFIFNLIYLELFQFSPFHMIDCIWYQRTPNFSKMLGTPESWQQLQSQPGARVVFPEEGHTFILTLALKN